MTRVTRWVAPLPGWNVRGYSYLERTATGELHPGADLNVGGGDDDLGLDVVCCVGGWVAARRVWDGQTCGYGNHVFVAHELGSEGLQLWTLYAHLAEMDEAAQEGARVEAGHRLGACGKSGWQEWAHLHFECRYQGPPEMAASYWGGGLSIEELSGLYADPFTLLRVLPALGEASGVDDVDQAAVAVLQADRDRNYAAKMLLEADRRAREGKRTTIRVGSTDALLRVVFG